MRTLPLRHALIVVEEFDFIAEIESGNTPDLAVQQE